MPKSRHRNKPYKPRRKTVQPPLSEPEFGLRSLKVTKERRRASNKAGLRKYGADREGFDALLFSMQVYLARPKDDGPAADRYFFRSIFLAASYLHEAIQLISSLRGAYGSDRAFDELMKLAYPTDRRREKILKLIRDRVGFHLDHDNKTVTAALKNLDLPEYELITGEGTRLGHLYVNIGDIVDVNHLIDELKGDRTEPEIQQEIFDTISDVTSEISEAAATFFTVLVQRLGLVSEIRQ